MQHLPMPERRIRVNFCMSLDLKPMVVLIAQVFNYLNGYWGVKDVSLLGLRFVCLLRSV